jgi:flagellar biosynthetic protein FliQ
MSEASTLHLLVRTLELALELSLPFLAAALLAGIVAGVAQAASGVSDPSVGQVPRALAVAAAVMLAGPWVIGQLTAFFHEVLSDFLPYLR